MKISIVKKPTQKLPMMAGQEILYERQQPSMANRIHFDATTGECQWQDQDP